MVMRNLLSVRTLISHAFLQFKEGFNINKKASEYPLSYPKAASWNSSTDCCSWDGVDIDGIKCHQHTNQVIHIDLSSSQLYGTLVANSSLFHLVHLQVLDLSDNDFNYSKIPSKIGELPRLKFLNLSLRVLFSREIPPQVSQLFMLLSLDLGGFRAVVHPKGSTSNLLQLKLSSLKSIIQNSTKHETLLLSFVTISSTLPDTLTNLTSLKKLSLYNSELYGEFPVGVFRLPNLELLDLGYNQNLNGSFPNFQSSSLTQLLLDDTGFYGALPVSIGKLSSLIVLKIRDCHFFGYIPSSLGNLTQLKAIFLRNNKFKGYPSASLANLTKLRTLEVALNEFTIETFSWVGRLSSLTGLDISSVNIGSGIPLSFANLTLEVFIARNSSIMGEIPSWIMNQTNLGILNLAYNFLHGKLELDTFLKFKNLIILNLSFNKLSLHSGNSSSRMIDYAIQSLVLASCNLVEIPTFIRDMADLDFLRGPIPQNNQFSTFKDDSFEGNQDLCGDQLLKKCIDHAGPSTSDDDDDDSGSSFFELYWTVVLIGYGGGLDAGVALGNTYFLQFSSVLVIAYCKSFLSV
ncbi:receptor-like protein 6 [Medicago truncatula]|uniref:receptor-like protein 6 n=1 Tax=Medicago truncatula TaxID=3880 RepID=UPI001968287F|nr:receptor-like protein 6 [Medicago truncatula]